MILSKLFLKSVTHDELYSVKQATLTKSDFTEPGAPTEEVLNPMINYSDPRSNHPFIQKKLNMKQNQNSDDTQINPDDNDDYISSLYNRKEQQYGLDKEYPYRTSQIEQTLRDIKVNILIQEHETFCLKQRIKQLQKFIHDKKEENEKITNVIHLFYQAMGNDLEEINSSQLVEGDQDYLSVYIDNLNSLYKLQETSLKNTGLVEKIEMYKKSNSRISKSLGKDSQDETDYIIQKLEDEMEKNKKEFNNMVESYENQLQDKERIIQNLRTHIEKKDFEKSIQGIKSLPDMSPNQSLRHEDDSHVRNSAKEAYLKLTDLMDAEDSHLHPNH